MNIHIIAIGGAIMHNLAIALRKQKHRVTGSDDEIFEPAKTRLQQYGLLPEREGWYQGKITSDLDIVILGMHAKADNPELQKAIELGLRVMSFPEFIYNHSKNKTRIAITGSHGKTTITSMIMHVLKHANKDFDYMVGSSVEGFTDSVKLTDDAKLMVIEGDEYLTSALDRRPKFMWYQPQISVINGVAWDHINVFPTYQSYLQQFIDFMGSLKQDSILIYNAQDKDVVSLVLEHGGHLFLVPTTLPDYSIYEEKTLIKSEGMQYTMEIFGRHNMQNMGCAWQVCKQLGVSREMFYTAMQTFKGAGKRLEKIYDTGQLVLFRDFAHSPSKVKATLAAVREQYVDFKIIAALELHTFSSLNPEFIQQYKTTMDDANEAMVYISPEVQRAKRGELISAKEIQKAFGRKDLLFTDQNEIVRRFISRTWSHYTVILLMSSGNFGGIEL
ncbi:MAG: Mur ligase family protein [Bacteroidetes bacterium]|nr:Mur ligase family protein [Bacteroidota bacterium]